MRIGGMVCCGMVYYGLVWDIVIPKSLAVQQRRMRADSSADTQDDDAFFDSEDDDEDQDESNVVLVTQVSSPILLVQATNGELGKFSTT
ncbi:hypothetical protein M0804_013988 [Polistes exclamans]|nr:hypothetical protein M0804_013989 [Polistes exclamans]KAI4475942.1 hypothetical protein M0804_013988 [Polistes exclamans]